MWCSISHMHDNIAAPILLPQMRRTETCRGSEATGEGVQWGVLEFPQFPSLNRFFGVGVVVLVLVVQGKQQGGQGQDRPSPAFNSTRNKITMSFFLSATPQHPLSPPQKSSSRKFVGATTTSKQSRKAKHMPRTIGHSGAGMSPSPTDTRCATAHWPRRQSPQVPPSGALYTAPDPLQPASGDLPLSRHDSSPTTARYLRQRRDVKI